MPWTMICDRLHGHPKAVAADLEAMGLWVLGLSHCGAYLTDGHVTRGAALRLTGGSERLDRLAAVLVCVGLWELHPSGDGWVYHDYLDVNHSRQKVVAEREKKRTAGQAGAEKRWRGSAQRADAGDAVDADDEPGAGPEASPMAPAMADALGPGNALPSETPCPSPLPLLSSSAPYPSPNTREELRAEARRAPARAPSVRELDVRGREPRATKSKHSPEQIAAKARVIDTFIESFQTAKGVRPQQIATADHTAAFQLVKTYGADDACAIVRRAMKDTFVAGKNSTLRYIASRPDTWRGAGSPASGSRTGHQAVPATGSVWKSALDSPRTETGERGSS